MRILDLFCGGGGASMGYYRAGYQVTGIDIVPQKNYPFAFIQDNALEYLIKYGQKYDIIHASPPCQKYSSITPDKSKHQGIIPELRELLIANGKPYIIENVSGAKNELINPILLCGTMFNLNVVRHRLFEVSIPIDRSKIPKCNHLKPVIRCGRYPNPDIHYHSVVGHYPNLEYAKVAMGIDWLNRDELAQAIPPAYTECLGVLIRDVRG